MNHCKNRLNFNIYAVKTPKDEVTCDTYWNFYKKLKIWTCFPQNGRFQDQTGGRETISQKGSLPFKTGGLEHMLSCLGLKFQQYSVWIVNFNTIIPYSLELQNQYRKSVRF